jgi:hypothetical protein
MSKVVLQKRIKDSPVARNAKVKADNQGVFAKAQNEGKRVAQVIAKSAQGLAITPAIPSQGQRIGEGVTLPAMSAKQAAAYADIAKTCLADSARVVLGYPYVKCPSGQYMSNSRVTGRVILRNPEGRKCEVLLQDYMPCFKLEDGRLVFEKHGQGTILQYLANGNTGQVPPLIRLVQYLAFCTLGLVIARQSTPREGNIKGRVFDRLEASGWKVESATMRDIQYPRETLVSKKDKLESLVQGAVQTGQYIIERGKKATMKDGGAW